MSDTDTATTTSATVVKRARRPNERFYIDNNTNIIRQVGDTSETIDLLETLSTEVWDRLACEGYIRLRKTGAAHADILAGKGFPDRALPVPKEGRAKRVAAQKEPGPWIKAIARVKAKDLIKAVRSSGQKVTDVEMYNASALAWAWSLSKEQVTTLRKHKLVRVAHAEITGDDGSLDDVLLPPVPQAVGASQSLEEAAD